MIESFGRTAPEPPPPPGDPNMPVTPTIAALVVPVMSPEALTALGDAVRMTIAAAVEAGLSEGAAAYHASAHAAQQTT